MEDEIQQKLKEFHKCNEEARSHFSAHLLKPGEPLHLHTERDLLLYAKWRTKADIALNEFYTLVTKMYPERLPWTLEQLVQENKEFHRKLARTEEWLKQY